MRRVPIRRADQRVEVARELLESNRLTLLRGSDASGDMYDLLMGVLEGRAVAVDDGDGGAHIEIDEEVAV